MDEGLPRLTLVWMYEGDDAEERRKVIAALDYPGVEVVSPDKGIPWINSRTLCPSTPKCAFSGQTTENPWARTS